ncbi:MAG: DUF7544 domain-containing protein [Chloroflexota bacterium]
MDYGALLGRAWQLTTRYRFLWILGLFAATTVGSCGSNGGTGAQYRFDNRDVERASPDMGRAFNEVGAWMAANAGLIAAVAIFFALLGLLVLVISFIAQGAMARATYDLAEGRETTLGQSWQAGVGYVWRYVGLWLIMVGLGILVAIVFGILFGGGALLAFGVQSLQGPLLVLGGLIGILVALVAIPLAIGLSVVVAYAQRAIVAENLGPWAALGAGYRLLRANLGSSFVVWLITIALGIAAGIALAIVAVLLAIPLGGIGALLWFVGNGINVAMGIYGVLALITFVGLLWLASGVVNAFFWNVWTLTYLQLSRRLPPGTQQV